MASEKPFPPSRSKLKKAREQGDIAKFWPLSAVLSTTMGLVAFRYFALEFQELSNLVREFLCGVEDFQSNNMLLSIGFVGRQILRLTVVPLGVCLLVGICGELAQTGWLLVPSALFKPSRLNPISGLKRLFGMEGGGESSSESGADSGNISQLREEGVRLLVYLTASCAVLLSIAVSCGRELAGREVATLEALYDACLRGVSAALTQLFLVFLALGVIGLFLAKRRRINRLRMTRTEFIRELKETEGNPEQQAARKELYREYLLTASLESVRRAKVVLVD